MLKYLNMTTAATFFIGHHSDYSSILLWPDSKQTRQCGQLILVFVSDLQRLFGHQQPIRHDMAEVCYVTAAILLFVSVSFPFIIFQSRTRISITTIGCYVAFDGAHGLSYHRCICFITGLSLFTFSSGQVPPLVSPTISMWSDLTSI